MNDTTAGYEHDFNANDGILTISGAMSGTSVSGLDILGDNARQVLSSLTFFVASPALLFETLSKARLAEVFAAPLLVAAVSAVATAAIFFAIARFWLKRSLPESLMKLTGSTLRIEAPVQQQLEGAYDVPAPAGPRVRAVRDLRAPVTLVAQGD